MTTTHTTVKTNSRINVSAVDKEKTLFLILFLFSIFAGATWPAGRIISQNLIPIGAAFYRYSIAVPIFIGISLINRNNHNDSLMWGRVSNNKIRLHVELAILGFLSVTLYTTLFLEGVKWTSASDATLIFAMTPTLTVMIANFVIPDEKITRNKALGLISAFIGVLIIFLQSPNTEVENRLYGNTLILISALVIAIYTVYSKPVFKKINVIDFSTWVMIYGWFFLLILALIQTPEYFSYKFISEIETKIVLSIIYLAVFIVYATIVLSYGVKRIGPSRSAIFMNLIPVFGIISSIIILGEKFSFWYLPAFISIMLGVYQVNKKSS
jgi:drug/metabolite transporter (DMT)-like permease